MKQIGALILAVFLAGCASGNNTQMLKVQLDEVTHRVRDLEATNTTIQTRLKHLETRITLLQDRLSAMRSAAPRYTSTGPAVPRGLPVQRVRPDVAPQVEGAEPGDIVVDNPVPAGSADSADRGRVLQGLPVAYDSIDENGDAHVQDQAPPAASVAARDKPPARPRVKQDQHAAYQAAFDAYRHGELSRAIAAFKAFLKAYPHTDLSDNAVYWIGECYYDQREFEKAKQYFTRVVTQYPKGNKVADAMLKMGMCNEMQNRFQDAKRLFKAVMLGFPDTSAARIAMDRMHALQ